MNVPSRLRKMLCILILVVYKYKSLSVYILTIVLNKKYNLKFQNKMKNEIKIGKFFSIVFLSRFFKPRLSFLKGY